MALVQIVTLLALLDFSIVRLLFAHGFLTSDTIGIYGLGDREDFILLHSEWSIFSPKLQLRVVVGLNSMLLRTHSYHRPK